MPKSSKLTLPKGTKIPNHIAIIPDGNRRWARARNLHTLKGHKKGFEAATKVARAARDMGIHTVTLWGFSTENWDRTREEIDYLMRLYVKLVDDHLKEAHESEVKLIHLGRKDRLPEFLIKKITQAEEETKHYKKYIANLAIDYGGHDDIIRAVAHMIDDGVSSDMINKQLFESYLDTKNQPYPYVDLLIRTSGEQRTSGLLLWQMEYAEMYWESDHFPSFTPEKLREAILDYSRRRRRFGGNDEERHLKFKPEVTAKLELDWWRLGKIPQDQTFGEYSVNHLRELYGLSKNHAKEAAKYLSLAMRYGEKKNWKNAKGEMAKFYELLKEELKLAFEPNVVASLDLRLMQNGYGKKNFTSEYEEDTKEFLAEVFRLSHFQAKKAAHLRALAANERRLAEEDQSEYHWDKTRDYLEKYYEALKERVA